MFENVKIQSTFVEVELPAYIAKEIYEVARYAHDDEGSPVVAKNYRVGNRVFKKFPKSFETRKRLQLKWYEQFKEKYPEEQRSIEEFLSLKEDDIPYSIYGHLEINISEEDVWKIVDKIVTNQHDEEKKRCYLKEEVENSISSQRYKEKYGAF